MTKLPKYVEIINYYKSMIESGAIKEGDPLPSEEEICKMFPVSHMTFTKAMNELAAGGYVKRIPRKGTIAIQRYKTIVRKALEGPGSITVLIQDSGMKPRADLIKYEVLKAREAPKTASVLNLGDEEYLHYFIRARYGDDQLVCISYTYITQAIMPSIDITRLEGSFNEYVKDMNIRRSYGYTEFCAKLPDPEQTEIIGSSRVPLLKQTIMWNVDNIPFELTHHFFVGDKYIVTQDIGIKLRRTDGAEP